LEIKEIISSGLLELYVAGIASEAESRQVEQWAATYPEVKEELNAIETALENYALGNAVQPADHVKNKVLAGVAAGKSTATPVKMDEPVLKKAPVVALWKRMAAASVILLAGSAIWSISLYNKNKTYQKELTAAQTALNNSEATAKVQQQAYLLNHHEMEVMLSEGVTQIAMQKTASAPDGCAAKIFWNKKTGEVYIDPCRMAKVPAGKTYQLWAIVNGKMVDAGIVKTGSVEDKYSIQKMKAFESAEGFAVTVEKAGGNTVPTLEQTYVTGKVA
jgi:Anti-sigma-K factor rskA